jgi:ABC-type branched-subunit amino acid transport system ATPase component
MILQLRNINFSFSERNTLLDNVNLSLNAKKIYALIGGNGSGKTTLLNLIIGFHKPKSGRIFFKDKDITQSPTYLINKAGIGKTFQDLRLIPKLTVNENVILAMQHNITDRLTNAVLPTWFFKKELEKTQVKAQIIINKFFLQEVQHSLANRLSFGQQKLLNLACCVANGGDLLLLDEPVAGISPLFKEEIAVLIKELKQQGITILMIEHSIDFISETADSFLFLKEGKITEFENFKDLKTSKEAADVYF